MFDKILPAVYRQLRQRSGLSQGQLATQLDVNRHTLANYETGKTRPDQARERRLVELAKCSNQQFAEVFCQCLSEVLGCRVAITDGDYQPTTAAARAERALHALRGEIPEPMLRALANQIHITQLMCLTFERQATNLEELTHDCLAAAG